MKSLLADSLHRLRTIRQLVLSGLDVGLSYAWNCRTWQVIAIEVSLISNSSVLKVVLKICVGVLMMNSRSVRTGNTMTAAFRLFLVMTSMMTSFYMGISGMSRRCYLRTIPRPCVSRLVF